MGLTNELRRALVLGLAISIPLGTAGVLAVVLLQPAPSRAVASPASPTVTSYATTTVTATVTASASPSPTAAVPTPQRVPQGTLVLDSTHETAASIQCAVAQTTYENRSDTTVGTISQQFRDDLATHCQRSARGGSTRGQSHLTCLAPPGALTGARSRWSSQRSSSAAGSAFEK